jgi:hypothetical protein
LGNELGGFQFLSFLVRDPLHVARRLCPFAGFIFLIRWGNRSVNCLPRIEVTTFRSDARCPLQEVAGASLGAAKI